MIIEQIHQLREFGISETDHVLTALLLKVNYSVERALNYYFEYGTIGLSEKLDL